MGTNTHPLQCVSMAGGRQHPRRGSRGVGWGSEVFLRAAASCCPAPCRVPVMGNRGANGLTLPGFGAVDPV